MTAGPRKKAGECPQAGCLMRAGHLGQCMAFGGDCAVPLADAPREPEVEVAELRAELELERRVRRRLVGALRDVQKVNVGAVIDGVMKEVGE
jgi:hypothetical protein